MAKNPASSPKLSPWFEAITPRRFAIRSGADETTVSAFLETAVGLIISLCVCM
jgi:hypothetical protein